MPYKFETEKVPMPTNKDRRIKLSPSQKQEIVELYATGQYSQRNLASIYGVSRRTIQFTIDPQKRIDNLERRKERGGWKIYYEKDKHTEQMREHRRYKNKILKESVNNEI